MKQFKRFSIAQNGFFLITWYVDFFKLLGMYVVEEIEQTALNTYLKPPSLWVRYADDVYVILEKTEVECFHDY